MKLLFQSTTLFIILSFFVSTDVFSEKIQYSGLSYVSGNSELQDLYPNTIKAEKDLRELIFSYQSLCL